MINCIIIDDEPLAQEVLENYIGKTPQLKLLKKCNNALEAFDVLSAYKVDLMFVDIKMPALNGIDFIKMLKNPPAVVFTTAFADHALTGFELEAVDYLLKPITYERFERAINKLLKIHQAEQPEQKAYTYFKVSGKLIKVLHTDLLYAQSVKDYILVCTTQGNYLTHMTMKFLMETLPANTFIRVHRSYMVNKNFINKVDKMSLTVGDEIIPVGDSYKGNVDLIG